MAVQQPEKPMANLIQLYVDLLNLQYLVGTGITASMVQPVGTDIKPTLLIEPLVSELAKDKIGRLPADKINANFTDFDNANFIDVDRFISHVIHHIAYEIAVTARQIDNMKLHPSMQKELLKHNQFYQKRYDENLRLFQAKQQYVMPFITKIHQVLEGTHLSVSMTGFNPKDVDTPDFPSLIISGFSRRDLAVVFGCITPRNRNKAYDSSTNIAEAELDWVLDCAGDSDNLKTADELVESIVNALEEDRIYLKAQKNGRSRNR